MEKKGKKSAMVDWSAVKDHREKPNGSVVPEGAAAALQFYDRII